MRDFLLFLREYWRFKKLDNGRERFSLRWRDRYACLGDKAAVTGFDRHYVYHTAWAARILAETSPERHLDISSSLYFCTLMSAFIPVEFFDYRRVDLELDGLQCDAADLCSLPFADSSVASLSCMHVVEHVGLGRYGDRLDPDGDLKAIAEMTRVVAKGGNLLFVVPVGGAPVILFNAHRIYTYDQIIGYFDSLQLVEFTLIPDDAKDGGLIRNATKKQSDAQRYGCGCFWFRKVQL